MQKPPIPLQLSARAGMSAQASWELSGSRVEMRRALANRPCGEGLPESQPAHTVQRSAKWGGGDTYLQQCALAFRFL